MKTLTLLAALSLGLYGCQRLPEQYEPEYSSAALDAAADADAGSADSEPSDRSFLRNQREPEIEE